MCDTMCMSYACQSLIMCTVCHVFGLCMCSKNGKAIEGNNYELRVCNSLCHAMYVVHSLIPRPLPRFENVGVAWGQGYVVHKNLIVRC